MDKLPITLHNDFKEFANCLTKFDVEFLVIGGYALAGHGVPRFTGDIDFWVDNHRDTCEKLLKVIDDFGFSFLGFTVEDLIKPGMMLQFGVPPFRIDVISSISGATFHECYPNRVYANVFGVSLPVMNMKDQLKNKIASNRPKDRSDVKTLKRLIAQLEKKQIEK